MDQRLSGQKKKNILLSFFCSSIPNLRDLDTKKALPIKDVCPESLGTMLA